TGDIRPSRLPSLESPAGRRWQSDHWCAHWTHRGAEAMRFGGWRRLHAERRDPVGKESTMKPAKNSTQKSPKSTTATEKKPKGVTDEERVAMRERLQELKADARRGRRADKAEGESAVLAKIAALPHAAKLQQRLADAEGRCTAPEWIATILVDKDHVTCRRGIFGEFNHSLRSGRPRVK